MLSALRKCSSPSRLALAQFRTVATHAPKREGDISDAFVSLSGQKFEPLTSEYADLKSRLIRGHENEVRESWERLLRHLREEIPLIVQLGSKIIPEIEFKDIDNAPQTYSKELRKRGVTIVRGVIPEEVALQWKEDLREYIRLNPQTRGILPGSVSSYDIMANQTQRFLPTVVRSLNCTGHVLNSSLEGTRICLRRNASSCLIGTAQIHMLRCQHNILSAMPIVCGCACLVMRNSH